VTTERTAEALAVRLFESSVAMFDIVSVYLGDRLGLYRALRDGGPATPGELAERAGIAPRYAREWLEQQAATDLLDVENAAASAEERRFSLPDAFAGPLLDPEDAWSMAPTARSVVAATRMADRLVAAYRTGEGIPWADYGPDMIEAQGDFNRPWLMGRLGSEILPSWSDLHARLGSDQPARVADVACGVGWAGIAVARAYPGVRVDGFDLDPSSIELANRHAAEAGVGDRASFSTGDVADAEAGAYDLAIVVEAIHDMSQPVPVLQGIRRLLRPGGVALVADEKVEDTFTAPTNEIERLLYGFSITTCLPSAMADQPSAAIGTVIREGTIRALAAEAGFSSVERLDEPELDMLRFYRLTP
jgi:2-polyprenyl-3-methyl-5-hydroxy-6-metoxy-1,4-benzoquinol methylase